MYKIIISALVLSYSTFGFASFSIDKTGLIVPAGRSESITVTNTSNTPIILFSTEDTEGTMALSGESLFKLEPMVAKLEPNQSQVVRVFSKNKNIESERIGRIRFIETSDVQDDIEQSIVSTGYNISSIVKPKNLPTNLEPWKFLRVLKKNGHVYIVNPSNYVVKINSTIEYRLIDGTSNDVVLSDGYIMPGTSIKVPKLTSDEFKVLYLHPILYNGTQSDMFELD